MSYSHKLSQRWQQKTQQRLRQREYVAKQPSLNQPVDYMMMWVECSITPTPSVGRIETFTIYDMWERR